MTTPTIFFGSSSYVLPLIEMLATNYDLKLVVTTEKQDGAVPTYCKANKIPYQSVNTLKDESIHQMLLAIHAPFAVLADFALFVPQKVLDLFPKGIINIHPSLLPKYRGSTPGLSAILYGETTTGVSIMLLDNQLDHGSLLGQVEEPVSSSDTSATLYPRLFEKGTRLLAEVLPKYVEGTIKPQEQDHSQASYSLEHLTRESGYIDIETAKNSSSEEIQRKVRAFYPWPGVWTIARLRDKEVRMKLLPGKMVQVEGKKAMSYKDFINGYPEGKEILQKLGLV